MKMKFKHVFLLLFFCTLCSVGQVERTIKHGQIVDFQKPIVGVHVYNLNTLQGTSTFTDGKFEILVKVNDTLIISHIEYRSLRVVISEEYMKREPFIIFMEVMTNYLDTVNIENHNLSGNLTTDTERSTKAKNKDSLYSTIQDQAQISSNRDYERDLARPSKNIVDPTGGPSVGSSVGIPFKFKDLEVRQELKIKRAFPKQIISDMGTPYFTKSLKIPKDKIHHFLTYCDHRDIISLYHKNEIMKVLTILQEESMEYAKIKD